jgi:hypothetical protein
VLMFMDDILVSSKDSQQHYQHVTKVLCDYALTPCMQPQTTAVSCGPQLYILAISSHQRVLQPFRVGWQQLKHGQSPLV